MNKLTIQQRAQIIGMLVEGNSIRATSRMSNTAYNTVLKLVGDIGVATSDFQDKIFRDLTCCKRFQVDEIWSFSYCKQKNIEKIKRRQEAHVGNVWTWIAICPDTKLIPSWHVGGREIKDARIFIQDLADRMGQRIHLTSDGLKAYVDAVDEAFGDDIDYCMLTKIYGANKRYMGSEKSVVVGKPRFDSSSTSLIERQNLTMRMSMRRFTRKTNGFSKKIENHSNSISLHFMWYNFGRIHRTLQVTPAMEAGLTDHIWELEEIVELIKEQPPKKRGNYKKRNSK